MSKYNQKGRIVQVVEDPDKEFGFPTGAQFTSDEVFHMMDMGSFTDGTIVNLPVGIYARRFQNLGFSKKGVYRIAGTKHQTAQKVAQCPV